MFSWAPIAILRFTLFFIGGVLFAIYSHESIAESKVLFILSISLIVYFVLRLTKRGKIILQSFGFLLILIAAFFSGYLCLSFNHVLNRPDHLAKFDEKISTYQLNITLPPEEKLKSYKVEGDVIAVKAEDGWHKRSGKILLYLSKTETAKHLQYGDVLLIAGTPLELSSPANPHEFDYKRFLSFRNIYHQHFVLPDSWIKIDHAPQHILIYHAQRIRAWAASVLKTHITGEQQQVIALALVLGIRDGIDNELQEAYAASGAMHVLAVSGLHVGVIFLLLNSIFKQFNFFEKKKWIQAVISLLALWSFAFITGLSASVLRAVTMFSLIIIAKASGKGDNIYNTLASAALILLLINPFLIMSVGFQLSFLAVIGIVSITRGVYDLWEPESLLIDRIWQITCVAFAAQLSTFALGMLYFHQFPVYFFFSNLFVIPGAFIILLSGIVCLLFSFIPPLAGIIGGLMEVCIWIMNKAVFTIEALPYSKVNDIYIDTLQTWLLLLSIACLVAFFYYKRLFLIKTALSFSILFGFITWQHFLEVRKLNSINIYRVNGLLAIDLIKNGNAFFFTDVPDWNDKERLRFHIRPNRLAHSVHSVQRLGPTDVTDLTWAQFILFDNKRILILKDIPPKLSEILEVDMLIPDKAWKGSLNMLEGAISYRQLLISSALNYSQVSKLSREALDLGIPFHNIQQEGALIINL
jgi:competence protein ComEC